MDKHMIKLLVLLIVLFSSAIIGRIYNYTLTETGLLINYGILLLIYLEIPNELIAEQRKGEK